jgi:hypothetical protein
MAAIHRGLLPSATDPSLSGTVSCIFLSFQSALTGNQRLSFRK